MAVEFDRMASGETAGEGIYFSKSSAKMSAMNHALEMKHKRNAAR